MTKTRPKVIPSFTVPKPKKPRPWAILILAVIVLFELAVIVQDKQTQCTLQIQVKAQHGVIVQLEDQLEIAQDVTDGQIQEIRDKDRHIAWLEKRHKEDQGKITELQGQDALLVDMVKRLQDKQP